MSLRWLEDFSVASADQGLTIKEKGSERFVKRGRNKIMKQWNWDLSAVKKEAVYALTLFSSVIPTTEEGGDHHQQDHPLVFDDDARLSLRFCSWSCRHFSSCYPVRGCRTVCLPFPLHIPHCILLLSTEEPRKDITTYFPIPPKQYPTS